MQSSSSTIASALASTHPISSSTFVTAAPGQTSLSGQLPHHVMVFGAGMHFNVPPSHVLPSCTEAPAIISQSSRVATTLHEFAVPVRQQKDEVALGVRLPPHLFLISA